MSVALHTTAGETPYDSDRLSNLKKVGNAFGSLIYDLKDDKSFEMFHDGCLTGLGCNSKHYRRPTHNAGKFCANSDM